MESLSRVSAMMDPARDLTSDAAQAVGVSKGLKSASSSKSIPFAKLKALLDSRSDRDILEGLRKVVAMIYQGKPCLPYFSSVVKNVANPHIEVKKLVYVYLLHYAESDPELALLSVNAINKSLTDQNPHVRAMALRTMSGLRVPMISQIVSLAIKRGVGDMSPHVRRAAALAIPKCYSLDPNTLSQLLEYLSTLIGDKQYFVVGPAVSAFLEICPDRIDLIHKHYRSLVKKLVDMDEWGQLATIRLLTVYSRRCFPYRTPKATEPTIEDFYDDTEPTEMDEETRLLKPDLLLFLKSCTLLLHSRSSAVVLSVVSTFYYLSPTTHLPSAIGPLISLMRTPPSISNVALHSIVAIALIHPTLFTPYVSHFLIHSTDSTEAHLLKLELLTLIFPHSPSHLKSVILSDLAHHSSEPALSQAAVQSIGRIAQSDPSTSSRAFKILLNQITSPDQILVSEVLTVIRHLIQQNPAAHTQTIVRLARNLDRNASPDARATIIWLVGEFAAGDVAPDVLRILLKGFADESEAVKQQILLLAAKAYLHHLLQNPHKDETHQIPKLWSYTLLLVRYDTSYDLRDRARLFKTLLSSSESTELASLILLAPKPVPRTQSPSQTRQGLLLGSAAMVLGGRDVGGYEDLPEWVAEGAEPDPRLRDVDGGDEARVAGGAGVSASRRLEEMVRREAKGGLAAAAGAAGGVGKGKGKGKTLDDWLDESESEDENENENENEDDTEEGETESEEESGDESEDEEDDDSEDEADTKKRLIS